MLVDPPAPLPPGVTEREVSFKTVDGLTLPGTLALPATTPGAGKPPVAVLEQGSGVQDRDATIGQNKFFQQLAYGFAARGVATIRYDRRAKVDRQNFMAHADLDHEVVLDAGAALAFAQTVVDTDPARVFYVGHSLGAELGPDVVLLRLSQKPNSVRGLVLLSGIARSPDAVVDEQIATLGARQGGTPEMIAALRAQWAAVWAEARDPKTPNNKPLGLGSKLPATYWRDWLRRDPVASMHKLALPMLVTRGAKDANATHADFELLSVAATTPGSKAREFPGLNHIYLPIAGEANGVDVTTAGTVSPEFLDLVAGWIRQTAGPVSPRP